MNSTLLSLTLMWKGMVAIFAVMIAIYLVLLIISPRKKGQDK
jgi:phage shock protein PspC (stress-responsive transcriptional regulator)